MGIAGIYTHHILNTDRGKGCSCAPNTIGIYRDSNMNRLGRFDNDCRFVKVLLHRA